MKLTLLKASTHANYWHDAKVLITWFLSRIITYGACLFAYVFLKCCCSLF
ncbi:hypothetical protein Hanom_Chr04g00293541 [Helianthus anomalus]